MIFLGRMCGKKHIGIKVSILWKWHIRQVCVFTDQQNQSDSCWHARSHSNYTQNTFGMHAHTQNHMLQTVLCNKRAHRCTADPLIMLPQAVSSSTSCRVHLQYCKCSHSLSLSVGLFHNLVNCLHTVGSIVWLHILYIPTAVPKCLQLNYNAF